MPARKIYIEARARNRRNLNADKIGKRKTFYFYKDEVNIFSADLDYKKKRGKATAKVKAAEDTVAEGGLHWKQIVQPRRLYRKSLSDLGRAARIARLTSVKGLVTQEFKDTSERVLRLTHQRCGVHLRRLDVTCKFRVKTAEGELESRLNILSDRGIIDITEAQWKKCQDIQEEENDAAHKILYSFCRRAISTRTLQDILSASDSSVKAWRVWQLKKEQNSELDRLVPILQLKVGYDAFYISPEKLLKYILPGMYANGEVEGNNLTVSLSGDGRNMKILREQGSIIVSLKISTGSSHETKYLFPIALARGKEKRENIELIMHRLRADLMRLKHYGVRIGERRIQIRLTFCSDGKFLLLVLGLQSANGKFSCPYCVLHKDHWVKCLYNRDYDLRNEERSPTNLARRIGGGHCYVHASDQICAASTHGKVRENLLDGLIEPSNIFIDELHLFLRLWDLTIFYLLAFCEHYSLEKYV